MPKVEYILYFIICFLLLIGVVPAFKELFERRYVELLYKVLPYIVYAIFFREILKINIYSKMYLLVMFVGALLHIGMNLPIPIIEDFLRWTMLAMLLGVGQKYGCFNKVFTIIILLFFMSECVIAIYERLTTTFTIDYLASDTYDLNNESIEFDRFRSTSLFRHPLNNANFISLFLGFLLCSKQRNRIFKCLLFSIGLIALWSENSRGAMVCWLFLLFYRFFLFNLNYKKVIFAGVFLLFIIEPLITLLLSTDLGGRFNFDFSDDSTMTRFLSYTLFMNEKWDFYRILAGGSIIYMPGTILSLENGVLLTLGYWGWIIGALKVVLEFLLTYKCLYNYDIKDKIIILTSFWGVAYMNNNSFNPLMLSMFVIVFIAFNVSKDKCLLKDS